LISLISPSEVKNPTSIAIGSFDGLHAGHRKLIKSVVEENQHVPTIAVSGLIQEKFYTKRRVLDLTSLMKNYLFLKISGLNN